LTASINGFEEAILCGDEEKVRIGFAIEAEDRLVKGKRPGILAEGDAVITIVLKKNSLEGEPLK